MRRLFDGEVLISVTAIVLDVEYCANNQARRTAMRRERSDLSGQLSLPPWCPLSLSP
jgi:hypothetical protein